MKKRIFSMLLCVCMVLTMLPVLPVAAATTNTAESEATYTVWLDGNGGLVSGFLGMGTNKIAPGTLIYEDSDIIIEPTRDGYIFAGWNTEPDGSGEDITFPYTMPARNVDFYAMWVEVGATFMLWIDGNGGLVSGFLGMGTNKIAPGTLIYEDSDIIIEPTRDGYTFVGWNTEPDGSGEDITFPYTMPARNVDFYAMWEEIKPTYTLTVNSNGGLLGPGSTVSSLDMEAGKELSEFLCRAYFNIRDREGYTFVGWNTEPDGTGEDFAMPFIMPDHDVTFYAIWEENKPEIEKFDIDFAQVILGNALNVNFAFPADAQDDWTSCYAVATKTYADGREDLTVTVPATEWKSATIQGAKHYYFSFSNVSGKEMADNIYVTIYNADDEAISNEYTESIRSYVMRILDDQNDETRTMLVDMLNYGSAAQASYTYGTDNLANSLLSETQKAYGSSTVKTCTDGRVKGANYQGTRLVLKNSILMQFGFEGLTADMTAKVEFTNHRGTKISETVTPVKLDNGSYAIEVNQIVAADGRIPVTVTVYDVDGNVYGTATDSMESYIARMGTSDPLYAAIMMFSDAAYAYLH